MRQRWIDRQNQDWQRTALIACVYANIHRGKRRPYKLEDFMPGGKSKTVQTPDQQLALLKSMFGAPKKGQGNGPKHR